MSDLGSFVAVALLGLLVLWVFLLWRRGGNHTVPHIDLLVYEAILRQERDTNLGLTHPGELVEQSQVNDLTFAEYDTFVKNYEAALEIYDKYRQVASDGSAADMATRTEYAARWSDGASYFGGVRQ